MWIDNYDGTKYYTTLNSDNTIGLTKDSSDGNIINISMLVYPDEFDYGEIFYYDTAGSSIPFKTFNNFTNASNSADCLIYIKYISYKSYEIVPANHLEN